MLVSLREGACNVSHGVPEEDWDNTVAPPESTLAVPQQSFDGKWQADLVQRCLAGDEMALSLMMDQYGNLLLRTVYLLVRDEEAAKDIVQETFILAWKNMGKLREPAFLRAWLIKIAVNQAISFKRQLARKAALLRQQLLQHDVERSIQEADFHRGLVEDHLDVEQAIGQLPLKQRTVLVLFYYHKMTMPEIATLLDVAENTLRKRLQAALGKLRKALKIQLSESEDSLVEPENIQSRIMMRRGDI